MNLLLNFRTYYFFFSFGFFLLSQNTLNLIYAQDVVVIIDDIESRLNVQGKLCNTETTFQTGVSVVKGHLKRERMMIRKKDEKERFLFLPLIKVSSG